MDNMDECHNENDPSKIPKEPSVDISDKCSICKGPKADPVSAKCGHSFCCACINEYLLSTRSNGKRRCPVCGIEMEAHVPGYEKQPKSDDHGNGNNVNCSICRNPHKEVVATHCDQLFCFVCFTELFVVKKAT
ncbi:E3 ubiquitin-protein ligase TRIM21-like [Drosophila obscura]|uniref:E3 ubiquitin-protein ligase TRIM21-like n=1 Tax=Drosophila obscura TaxID=7282 RepID=UPI001BB15217|nr:E3 ubiquitin-protein ligase TRIM21-like [Drosophila obscura]